MVSLRTLYLIFLAYLPTKLTFFSHIQDQDTVEIIVVLCIYGGPVIHATYVIPFTRS